MTRRAIAAALLVVVPFSGGWAVRGLLAERDASQAQAAASGAELAAMRAEAQTMAGIAADLEQRVAVLRDQKPKLVERYYRETVQKPLPADCVLDDGRVRVINEAVQLANAAGVDGRAVSGSGAIGDGRR